MDCTCGKILWSICDALAGVFMAAHMCMQCSYILIRKEWSPAKTNKRDVQATDALLGLILDDQL